MKKNLLLLLLLALSVYAIAQDPAQVKLMQELNAHPQQDISRVNLLNEMAFYKLNEKIYNEAFDISVKIGYSAGEAYALTYIAFSKFINNYRKEGDSLFRRADSIAKKTASLDLLATVQVYHGYATLYEDSKIGLTLLLEAEKTVERSGNKKLLALCQHFIAIEYANGQSDIPKGMEYYLKSIKTAEEVNYLRFICAGYISIGGLYNRIDDKANAILYYQKAREANKQFKSPAIDGRLLIHEGNEYEKAGRYTESIDAFKKALKISSEADSGLIVSIQMNLAEVYNRTDSLSLAFKYAISSVNYAKRKGDDLLYASAVMPLSENYLKNKMPDSAIYYAKLGYDYSKRIGAVEVMRDNAEALTMPTYIRRTLQMPIVIICYLSITGTAY